MENNQNIPNQLTKVLDVNSTRKKGLTNFYMMAVEIPKLLGLTEEAESKVFGNMLEVSKKLAKLADAVDNYEKTEKKEIKKLIKEVPRHGNPNLILAEDSSKLEAIVEEALSQAKSALDVAVKVLDPIVGIKLNTFGEGGNQVIKALKNNTPKDLLARTQFLTDLIENEDDWIRNMKKYRDDQHYKNIGITPIRANASGQAESPRMPGPGGQTVSAYLDVVYVNMFTFLMDFVAGVYYIKLPTGLGLVAEGEGINKKFRLAIDGPITQENKEE